MELLLSRELSCLTTRAKMTLRLFSNTLFLVAVELLPRLCPPEGTRKEGSDFFPPISSSISSVSFRSGSKPRLPPGEDSKRKPKSVGKCVNCETQPLTYNKRIMNKQILQFTILHRKNLPGTSNHSLHPKKNH